MSAGGTRRIVAVDAMRGMTIAGMVLVNNPGRWGVQYAPLTHAEWHGWTVTDLVFPFFLFLVGVSIHLALGRKLEAGVERGPIARTAVRRACVLFGLGLFLAAFPFVQFEPEFGWRKSLATLRVFGVLQRISVCFLAASLLYLWTSARTQRWVTVALLLGYWAAMVWVPVPGHGAGAIDDKAGNFAAWIDRSVLGDHVWRRGVYDPEGLLSTLPALATCLLGVQTGRVLGSADDVRDKLVWLLRTGFLLTACGYVWDWFFPINKPLWTSSYVVFTAGLAMSVLACWMWCVDVRGRHRVAKPFVVFGVNAITVFVASGCTARVLSMIRVTNDAGQVRSLYTWLYEQLLVIWAPLNASLAYAVGTVLVWYAVLRVMFARGWILRV